MGWFRVLVLCVGVMRWSYVLVSCVVGVCVCRCYVLVLCVGLMYVWHTLVLRVGCMWSMCVLVFCVGCM